MLLLTEEGNELFKTWLVQQDWQGVLGASGSNNKAEKYQEMMSNAMRDFYPVITTKKKSTEDPWINDKIRKKIKPVSYTHLTLPTIYSV